MPYSEELQSKKSELNHQIFNWDLNWRENDSSVYVNLGDLPDLEDKMGKLCHEIKGEKRWKEGI